MATLVRAARWLCSTAPQYGPEPSLEDQWWVAIR